MEFWRTRPFLNHACIWVSMIVAGWMWWRVKKRVSWVISPPTLTKQEDSEGCSIGIYTVAGWLRTHLCQNFNFELSHATGTPQFLGAALVPMSIMGETRAQLSSYLLWGLHVLAWSWLPISLVKQKCECFPTRPGETSALPESGHAGERL